MSFGLILKIITRSGKINDNKIQQISVKAQVFFVKTELQHIYLFTESLTHDKIIH